jgi:MFS family permease
VAASAASYMFDSFDTYMVSFAMPVLGTANSWSSAAGKLAAALSPLVFGFAMARHWYYAIFVIMAIFFGAACTIIFALDIEPKGKALADLGAS